MADYKMIPVDEATKKNLIALATRLGFGERGQGAVVRILVNEKLLKLGMAIVPAKDDGVAILLPVPVVDGDAGPMPAIDDVA